MKRILSALFLIALVAGTVIVLSSSKYRESEGKIFGTVYHIKYSYTENLDDDIVECLQGVDNALSMFNDSSTLSQFNQGKAYADNPLFDDVVKLGLQVSKETDGAFDMTVAPLVNAWGFGFKNSENVTPAMVDSIRNFVGYSLLTFDGKKLTRKDSRTTLDCGAIAKGYGVDCVARMLSQKGCTNYMVEIGGEVVVKGKNPDGKKWTLGINKPVDDSTNVNNEIQQIISLTDCGIATSGNYRNFYYKGGKKVAHTIDPKTGYPVEHSLLSATIIAGSCALADAYATSFMVMGLEKGKAFAQAHPNIQVYLIYSDDKGNLKTWQSSKFQKYIVKE